MPKQSNSWGLGDRSQDASALGDNGKPNDNMIMHILSPYPDHRSALTDCSKLATCTKTAGSSGGKCNILTVAADSSGTVPQLGEPGCAVADAPDRLSTFRLMLLRPGEVQVLWVASF